VAHTYNPSYSRARDQEVHGSKPALENRSQAHISKTPSQKRAGGVAQGLDPEFKLQHCPRPRKKEELQIGTGVRKFSFYCYKVFYRLRKL
jgi:hypothetical protein